MQLILIKLEFIVKTQCNVKTTFKLPLKQISNHIHTKFNYITNVLISLKQEICK